MQRRSLELASQGASFPLQLDLLSTNLQWDGKHFLHIKECNSIQDLR